MSEVLPMQGYDYDPEDYEHYRPVEVEAKAHADPYLDFFTKLRPRRSKEAVGAYVKSQGFQVPLIQSKEQWEAAFDEGKAMIRSDSGQDYDGLSGLYSSTVLSDDQKYYAGGGLYGETKTQFQELIWKGLRSGETNPDWYMQKFLWNRSEFRILESANEMGVQLYLDYSHETSLWRYIPGLNLRIFRDPHVDEKYYLGCDKPYKLGAETSGEQDIVLPEKAGVIKTQKLVELYESVRALPRFDQSQVPVMEVQQDEDGKMHFLQYLKVHKRLEPAEEFDLPDVKNALIMENVRGITSSEGKDLKFYINPRRLYKHMQDQGFYLSLHALEGLRTQVICSFADSVIQAGYVSFKDNHFNSAPLYRPRLAVGLWDHWDVERKFAEIERKFNGSSVWDKPKEGNIFINGRITSNGRKALFETDFEPHFEPYNTYLPSEE